MFDANQGQNNDRGCPERALSGTTSMPIISIPVPAIAHRLVRGPLNRASGPILPRHPARS
jgi:hypothetical protein